MTGTRRVIDRRTRPRFEVVGDLSGVLDVARPLAIVDVCSGGALIASDRRWEIGSVHSIVIANRIEVGRAEICVKCVRSAAEGPPHFLVGVEFLSMSPALAEEIARWVAAEGDMAARPEGL